MIANIHDAKTHFSQYLARALAGEEVIVAKAGKPVAKLVPIRQPSRKKKAAKRIIGQYEGFYVPDSAFAPLTEEELKDWHDGPIFP